LSSANSPEFLKPLTELRSAAKMAGIDRPIEVAALTAVMTGSTGISPV
jgi:hypothetical protein